MSNEEPTQVSEAGSKPPICGIVMPISAIDSCPESHWKDVHTIITDAVKMAGFTANLVSEADEAGVIQRSIISNLYNNPIVVCDVSCKNPNVMFELGMRLAFDKPTIIIKDNLTSYSFDTAPIEHVPYPRDLRHGQILEFKEKLALKIQATYEKSKDKTYSTFLKHFGSYEVATMDTRTVSSDVLILEELSNLKRLISRKEPVISDMQLTRWRNEITEDTHDIPFNLIRVIDSIILNLQPTANTAEVMSNRISKQLFSQVGAIADVSEENLTRLIDQRLHKYLSSNR